MQDSSFVSLITSFYFAGWQQLGKVAHPVSGKIEKDVAQAKHSIDILIMLREKTEGNLADEEKKALNEIIANLQLNYLDEKKKDDLTKKDKEPKQEKKKDKEENKKEEKEENKKEEKKDEGAGAQPEPAKGAEAKQQSGQDAGKKKE